MSSLKKLAYHVRRMDWLIFNQFINEKNTIIDRPIFLLGNQGGGNTFLSRIIRRNREVVSCTGNSKYWTGADEMQRVFELSLPKTLRLAGRMTNTDPHHPKYPVPRSWSYGADDLFEKYHLTELDYAQKDALKFRRIIKKCLQRYGADHNHRFFDKSQVYTLKTRYIASLLNDTTVYFVLMTRDPIISVYRAAMGKAGDMARYAHLSETNKITTCAQHWNNCMRTALEDSIHLEKFIHLRFEDLLEDPYKEVAELCNFLEIEFDEDMMPQKHHKIPYATRYLDRWWPLRKGVNKQYSVPPHYRKIIEEICGQTAERLGY